VVKIATFEHWLACMPVFVAVMSRPWMTGTVGPGGCVVAGGVVAGAVVDGDGLCVTVWVLVAVTVTVLVTVSGGCVTVSVTVVGTGIVTVDGVGRGVHCHVPASPDSPGRSTIGSPAGQPIGGESSPASATAPATAPPVTIVAMSTTAVTKP
jgi:hypothetical protein